MSYTAVEWMPWRHVFCDRTQVAFAYLGWSMAPQVTTSRAAGDTAAKARLRDDRRDQFWCENVMKVTLTYLDNIIWYKKRWQVLEGSLKEASPFVTVEAPWFLDYFVLWALAIPQSRYPQQGTQYSTQTSVLFGTGRSSMIQGFLGEGITCQPWMSRITWDIAGLLHLPSPARHSTGGGSSALVGNVTMTHSLFRIFQARPLCPDNISFEEAETALHCWTNTCQERDLGEDPFGSLSTWVDLQTTCRAQLVDECFGARLTALFQASQTVDRTIIWSNGMLACFITVQEKNRHEFWEVICNDCPK